MATDWGGNYPDTNLTTGGGADLIAFQYYDRLFLLYALPRLAWYQFAQKRPLPRSQGDLIWFTRYNTLGRLNAALTEGQNPSSQTLSLARLSAQVNEWGGVLAISSLLDLTSIDPEVSEAAALMGIQAGETVDWQVQLQTLTAGAVTGRYIYPSGENFSSAAATQITSTLDTAMVREGVFRLKIAKTVKFDANYFASIISPYAEFDLTGDSGWVDASLYAGATQLYEGEIGKWFGVRFVEDTNPLTLGQNNNTLASTTLPPLSGSTGALGITPIFGKESFGVSELTGRKIIIKTSGPNDTFNSLNMFRTVGWKQTFATRFLNENWIAPLISNLTLSGVT